MSFDFYMPDIGEGVVEGEIVSWKVKVGDKVALDQVLVEVMTDKATVELPSPRAGTVLAINYKDGDICPVGKVLVTIETSDGVVAAPPPKAHGHSNGAPKAHTTELVTERIQVADASADRARVLATPATRRLAREMGIEIGRVTATGPHGRVTTKDVKGHGDAPAPRTQHAPNVVAKGGDEERIPLRGMRKKIAESMARSVHTAAHFTYVEEVDMTELVHVRARAKDRAAERGVKLNYLPFIVKAVVSGLKKWPALNASLDESTQEIVRKKYYHIGIAAQGPHGLAVSVVREADKRSIFDLSREIDRLGEAVKAGTATRDELTGSTFTISSLGKLGGVLATPIINFPEVAIIGVHKIEERPAVRQGQIVARHLMNLSISVDHRLADGWDGAMFLQDVKTLLEDPTTMFMENGLTRALLALLVACGGTPAPIAKPPPVHASDWQVAKTEVYRGKQDDLYFVDGKVGFYGNGAGKIFRTDDGGVTWKQVLSKPGTYIRALGFLDAKRGFAGNIGPDSFPGVTDTTLLYRTDDGGTSWQPVALPDVEGARGVCAIDILAVDAVNAGHRLHKEIVHVGGRVGGPASLHASDDGGATWKRIAIPPEVAMILDVHFVDVSTGFLFAGSDPDVTKSNGIIAKTSDSGRTWKIVYRSARPFELMWKGSFPTRTIGYATLQNYTGEAAQDPEAHVTPIAERFVVKTTDGGDTWKELPMARNAAVQEFGIGFVDDQRGWIGALPQGFATTDGGATWTPAPTLPLAANKLRVVHDGATTHVWSIGLDVRHLDLTP